MFKNLRKLAASFKQPLARNTLEANKPASQGLMSSINQSIRSASDLLPANLQMSSLQMNNKMFVSKSILQQQVDIMQNPKIPEALKSSDNYVYRHMGNSLHSTKRMLDQLGYDNLENFIKEVVPDAIKLNDGNYFKHQGNELNGIKSETLMLERMRQFASNNIVHKSFIGQGYYGTQCPSVIRRNVLENPKWYTPYTPYQPEIA